jgi:hypothetical protein
VRKFKLFLLLFSFVILISACTPTGSARGFAYIWYVATGGDNTDTCAAPTQACATLAGALARATSETSRQERAYPEETLTILHTIHVAGGVYEEGASSEGSPFASIRLNVTVQGAGQGVTVFDSLGLYGGILVDGNVSVSLRNFTVINVNGSAPDSCINIRGAAVTTIERVTVRSCERTGITHLSTGPLTLINVSANRTLEWEDRPGYGFGVYSIGDLTIEGGHFFLNAGPGITSLGTLTMHGGRVYTNQREGIYLSDATATLDGVAIEGNGTDGSFRAGLFLGDGAVATVSNSTISDNEYGAWLRGAGASLNLIDSSVTGHPRTGIVVSEGELRLTRSLIAGNASSYTGTSHGGGLSVENGARAILRESEVSGNLNGGITNSGELFLVASALIENDGGMPALFNDTDATTIIEQSLIANNMLTETPVTGFHAVDNRGTLNIVNATISGNQGAGIANFGALNLAYSTVAFNAGVGLSTVNLATASSWLAGDIFAGNETNCFLAGAAVLTYDGANIDTDGSCNTSLMIALADLHLGALADNGGPTLTHALLPGSPAIEAATSSTCPSHDQRVTRRPFGPSCDLGAYEAGGSTLSLEATLTPGSGDLIAIPELDYNCRYGNSIMFDIADTLKAGEEYTPKGKGFDLSWIQFEGPAFGELCWVPASGLTFFLDGLEITLAQLPDGALSFVAYPAAPTATTDPDESSDASATPQPGKPTATPKPKPSATATCYYDQNQNYICP